MNRKQRRAQPQPPAPFRPFAAWWAMDKASRNLKGAMSFLAFVTREFGEGSVEQDMATHLVGERAALLKKAVADWNAQKDAGFMPKVNGLPNKDWQWPE